MQGLQQFFGLNRERTVFDSPFVIPQDQLVCMVSNVIEASKQDLINQTGIKFQIGDWFVSAGACPNTVVHGPFKNLKQAFDFSKEKFNVVRFLS